MIATPVTHRSQAQASMKARSRATTFDSLRPSRIHRQAQHIATFGNAPDVRTVSASKIDDASSLNRRDHFGAVALWASLGIHGMAPIKQVPSLTWSRTNAGHFDVRRLHS